MRPQATAAWGWRGGEGGDVRGGEVEGLSGGQRTGTCHAFGGRVRSTTLNVLLSVVCPRRTAGFPARTSGTAIAKAISPRASRDPRSQSGNRGRAGPHAR